MLFFSFFPGLVHAFTLRCDEIRVRCIGSFSYPDLAADTFWSETCVLVRSSRIFSIGAFREIAAQLHGYGLSGHSVRGDNKAEQKLLMVASGSTAKS